MINSWPMVRLGNLVENLQSGFAQSPNSAGSNTPQIRTHNVSREGEIDLTGIKLVNATSDELEKYGLVKGDIIFNNTNGPELVGKTAFYYLPDVMVMSNHMTRIRVSQELVDAEYLARYLHNLWLIGRSRNLAKQWVSQAAIDQDALSAIEIPLPPLPEQQRIAAILRFTTSLRRQRREADEVTQKILPALFYEMFGDPATNPKKWPMVKVGNLMISCEYGSSQKANETGQGIPIIRMNNVSFNGDLLLEDLKHVNLSEQDYQKYALKPGDILFNRTNSRELVGKTALWDGQFDAVPASYFIRLRFDTDEEHPLHFVIFMNLPYMKKRLLDMARGAIGQANINSKELQSIMLPKPPIDLQRKFADYASKLSFSIKDQSPGGNEMDILFGSLLARAFTGDLTEAWRANNLVELQEAAEQRDAWLQERGIRRSAERASETQTQPETAEIPFPGLSAGLSIAQQCVLDMVKRHPTPHFTLQSLWDSDNNHDDGRPSVERGSIERGLALLETLGIIQRVNILTSPSGEAYYQTVYRRAEAQSLEEELKSLKASFPNIRL